MFKGRRSSGQASRQINTSVFLYISLSSSVNVIADLCLQQRLEVNAEQRGQFV